MDILETSSARGSWDIVKALVGAGMLEALDIGMGCGIIGAYECVNRHGSHCCAEAFRSI
jgi:hypothetical protein